jgi:hypothetical protein
MKKRLSILRPKMKQRASETKKRRSLITRIIFMMQRNIHNLRWHNDMGTVRAEEIKRKYLVGWNSKLKNIWSYQLQFKQNNEAENRIFFKTETEALATASVHWSLYA